MQAFASEANFKAYKEQSLIYTQKHGIKIGPDKGMVIYTYLNPILAKSIQNELFILSVAPKFLKINSLRVVVEGSEAVVEPLNYDAKVLNLVIKNKYAKYFLITSFKLYNKEKLSSQICINESCFLLTNQKVVKSLFFRSKD